MKIDKGNIILEKSLELFFNHGIQHITMDDIAEKCYISKKTIYKYFDNKNDLLHQIIKLQVKELQDIIRANKQKKINALEELVLFFKYINNLSHTIFPAFGKELKKYHPAIFLETYKYKNTIILPFVIENIEKGKNEGLYKKNINAEEICDSFDNISKIIFSDGFLLDTNKASIEFLNSLFLHRLVSVKGFEILKKQSDN
tara:strand:- start:753 stop:1352 length:600 start_codon:yes stop_codon:yes gene_type:complete